MRRPQFVMASDLDQGLLGPPSTAFQAFGIFAACVVAAVAVPVVVGLLDAELGVVLGYIIDAFLISALVPTALRYRLRARFGSSPPIKKVFISYVVIGLPLNLTVSYVALHLLMGYPGYGSRSLEAIATPGVTAVGVTILMLVLYVYLKNREKLIASAQGMVHAARAEASQASMEKQLMQARLTTLQAQIEPHFLYNTLANVQYLIPERPDDADLMLSSLIRYLRQSLPRMRSEGSTLGQEFDLTRAYLDIARIRQGDRLKVDVNLPDEMRPIPFPPLLIQTLVENALKHGIERKPGPVSVRVLARLEEGRLVVSVADDGAGLKPETQGNGVGLKNTRERLAALYGPDATLRLQSGRPSGVIAEMSVPLAQAQH